MKEEFLNHLVPNRGSGQDGIAEEPSARPNGMPRGLVLKGKRTEELTTEGIEALTIEQNTERTDVLTIEQTTSLTKKRTVSPGREETDESLGNGLLEGTSEGSVQLESKAPSIASDNEELHPAVENCTKGAAGPPKVQEGEAAPPKVPDGEEAPPKVPDGEEAPPKVRDGEEAPPKVPDGEEAPPKVPDGEGAQEPPLDWLEPLEDDDDVDDDEEEYGGQNWEQRRVNGKWEAEEESVAGESERSGSMAGSNRKVVRQRRRPQSVVDEDWEDWPILGKGWKRKEVFRRSGFSVGKTDTYYLSPKGDRLRSKIELARNLAGVMDITKFDFKSGLFMDHGTFRKMRKRRKFHKMPGSVGKRQFSTDVSSSPCRPRMMKQKKTPPQQPHIGRARSITTPPRTTPPNLATPPRPITITPPRPTPPRHSTALPSPTPPFSPISLSSTPHSPIRHAQRLRPLLKQEAGSPDCTQPELPASGCSRCGGPVAGVELWRKGSKSLCLKCKGRRKDDYSNIVFRKWLPCGHCRACLLTEDCGMCASCRNGRLNRDGGKPVRCRKRKCLCPIRKKTAKERLAEKEMEKRVNLVEPYIASEVTKVKPCSINKESASELTVCIDGDDEEEDEDVYEFLLQRRISGPCGRCAGCLRSADCGSCSSCAGRAAPTAHGNAPRPCRRRRCLRPAGLVQRIVREGWMGIGRPRPHYSTSSYWGNRHKRKAPWDDFQFSEDEGEKDLTGTERTGSSKLREDVDKDAGVGTYQNCFKADSQRTDIVKGNRSLAGVTDISHSISGISSLAEGAQADGEGRGEEASGVALEPELQSLLEALRRMALPPHWVGLLTDGPSLQLLQCSKRSTMADTSLLIDGGFFYQISVQGQPLPHTHPLYKDHPRRLPTVAHVVALLLDLERYAVCQGFPAPTPAPTPTPPRSKQPVIPERAAVCSFLVLKNEERCVRCGAGEKTP